MFSSFTMCRIAPLFGFLLTVLASPAQAAYSSLVIFGDSLSDTGNLYAATGGLYPQAPYDNGRFSNGPVFTEVLASRLGLSAQYSLAGGSNYAYGGATVVTGGSLTPSLEQQYGTYMGDVSGAVDSNALYVVFGGANDLFNSNTQAAATAAADSLVSIVGNLVSAGAYNILVPNLPDLGTTPGSLGDAGASTRSALFNTTLTAGLSGVSGANIMRLDVRSILADSIADPAAYGYSNVTDACYNGAYTGGGTVCADPDSYLFWDGVHPTAAAHRILGDRAFAVVSPVPVPATLGLFGSALLTLVALRRRGLAGESQ